MGCETSKTNSRTKCDTKHMKSEIASNCAKMPREVYKKYLDILYPPYLKTRFFYVSREGHFFPFRILKGFWSKGVFFSEATFGCVCWTKMGKIS